MTFRNFADFNVFADRDLDQSDAIQAAIDTVSAQGGGTLWYDYGRYRQKKVYLKPGVTLRGQDTGTIIKKPDANGQPTSVTKGWRVISTRPEDFPDDAAHARGVGVHNMIVDGNRDGVDWDGTFSQEQAHCIFLTGNTSNGNRLRAKVSNVHCQNNVADGLNAYTDVALEATNISAENCFRGGFVSTGHNNDINITNLSVDASGIDLEPNFPAQRPSNINLTNVTCGGDLDVGATDTSCIVLTNVNMTGPGWNMGCDGTATLIVNGGRFIAGPADGRKNRLNYPAKATFNGTEFLVAYDPNQPDLNLYCLNVYTKKSPGGQRLQLNNCRYGISGDLPPAFDKEIQAIHVQASPLDDDNWVIVNGGYCEDPRFTRAIFMNRGPKLQIGNGFRCGAKQFAFLNHDASYQGHFIIGDVTLTDTCEEYAYIGNPNTGDTVIIEHRDTRVREAANKLTMARDEAPPDSWFRGRRIIEGATDPTLDPTPGLKGDIYRTSNLVPGGPYEWVCTASHITQASWAPLVSLDG